MFNKFKKKYQHIELSFNLVMTIGKEINKVLEPVMQYLNHPQNDYLAPYKFLAVNSNETDLHDDILYYQAKYNDITEIYLYVKKADFIFLIIDQADDATQAILTKILLLNQNVILFVKPPQTEQGKDYLSALPDMLKIYVSDRENKRSSELKMAEAVFSIINLVNKTPITSVDFPDLYFASSEQPFSYLGISMRTNAQSVEDLTKLALFDTQTNLRHAKYVTVLISADSSFTLCELHTVWNIIGGHTNPNIEPLFSFDLVENSEQRINYIGVLVAGEPV